MVNVGRLVRERHTLEPVADNPPHGELETWPAGQ